MCQQYLSDQSSPCAVTECYFTFWTLNGLRLRGNLRSSEFKGNMVIKHRIWGFSKSLKQTHQKCVCTPSSGSNLLSVPNILNKPCKRKEQPILIQVLEGVTVLNVRRKWFWILKNHCWCSVGSPHLGWLYAYPSLVVVVLSSFCFVFMVKLVEDPSCQPWINNPLSPKLADIVHGHSRRASYSATTTPASTSIPRQASLWPSSRVGKNDSLGFLPSFLRPKGSG